MTNSNTLFTAEPLWQVKYNLEGLKLVLGLRTRTSTGTRELREAREVAGQQFSLALAAYGNKLFSGNVDLTTKQEHLVQDMFDCSGFASQDIHKLDKLGKIVTEILEQQTPSTLSYMSQRTLVEQSAYSQPEMISIPMHGFGPIFRLLTGIDLLDSLGVIRLKDNPTSESTKALLVETLRDEAFPDDEVLADYHEMITTVISELQARGNAGSQIGKYELGEPVKFNQPSAGNPALDKLHGLLDPRCAI